MKKYITPRIDFIEIKPEERLAACEDPGSCVERGEFPDGLFELYPTYLVLS